MCVSEASEVVITTIALHQCTFTTCPSEQREIIPCASRRSSTSSAILLDLFPFSYPSTNAVFSTSSLPDQCVIGGDYVLTLCVKPRINESIINNSVDLGLVRALRVEIKGNNTVDGLWEVRVGLPTGTSTDGVVRKGDIYGRLPVSEPVCLVERKITEPKTPYHPMIDVDDEDDDTSSPGKRGSFGKTFEDAMHAEAIRTALNDVGSSSKNVVHISGWTSSEDDMDIMDHDGEVFESDTKSEAAGSECERRKNFREHRKAHYDEFRKVKELRRKGSLLEDDESDLDAEHEKANGPTESSSSITAGVKEMEIKESSPPTNVQREGFSQLDLATYFMWNFVHDMQYVLERPGLLSAHCLNSPLTGSVWRPLSLVTVSLFTETKSEKLSRPEVRKERGILPKKERSEGKREDRWRGRPVRDGHRYNKYTPLRSNPTVVLETTKKRMNGDKITWTKSMREGRTLKSARRSLDLTEESSCP
ncbi:phosphoprotein phosphatase inhibitors [Striga asiatica]|uniref:Phosphoprotein phosphatase inhibitors n=1 Tax=Striga asiatica TaxID=4170 RepID=A0A5A7NXU6_STRAF|nr:phosphoprotein phosphatase inhibitors [Striga asiatica]